MGTQAHGRIVFWEGASLWILEAEKGRVYPRTAVHAHHALQLSLALRGRVDFESGERSLGGVAIAVAPDAPHTFEGTGLIAQLFVAPESTAGRAIRRALFTADPLVPLPDLGDLPVQLRACFEKPRPSEDSLRDLGRRVVAHLAGTGGALEPYDPRIDRAIAFITTRLGQEVTLGQVATLMKLSPGRARHLFVQQTGLSFRVFLLWLRLSRALELFARGDSLTEAGHAAGFADSAHLSRTFRRMFGITAASLRLS